MDGGTSGGPADSSLRREPSYEKLALPRWEMGQILHPDQFRAQEQALLEHVGLRTQLTGLPSYGVALLRWDEDQRAAGDLSLSELTVVLPSGLTIAYPHNASLTTRTLGLPAKADQPVSVYLRVRHGAPPGTADDPARYENKVHEVARAMYQLELATEPGTEISAEGGVEIQQEAIKLAELSRGLSGWALTPFVPPLLRVGRDVTPFLTGTFEGAARDLAAFETELVRRAADSMIGAEQLSEVRRILAAVRRVQALLADHGYGGAPAAVALHPYHLFVALRDFGLEAAMTPARDLGAWPARYQHDDLQASFAQVVQGLSRALSVPRVVPSRLQFQRDKHLFVAGPFPAELVSASSVFLLLERASESGAPPVLDDFKLASPHRVEEVYTRALAGVPWQAVPSLGFEQSFGDRATVVQLDIGSLEWREAVDDGAVCFAVRPGLADCPASLFWQKTDRG